MPSYLSQVALCLASLLQFSVGEQPTSKVATLAAATPTTAVKIPTAAAIFSAAATKIPNSEPVYPKLFLHENHVCKSV